MTRSSALAFACLFLGLASLAACKGGESSTSTGHSTTTTKSGTGGSGTGGAGIGGQGQGGEPATMVTGTIATQPFTAVDAVFMDGIETVDGASVAGLAIYFRDKPGICDAYKAGEVPPSSTTLFVDLVAHHLGPGTYPLQGIAGSAPYSIAGYQMLDWQCSTLGSVGSDQGSSVTITEITKSTVSGHLTLTASDITVSGPFTATACAAGFIEPDKAPTQCTPADGG